MNNTLFAAMRAIILDRYGVDIENAQCHFSTPNYALCFQGG